MVSVSFEPFASRTLSTCEGLTVRSRRRADRAIVARHLPIGTRSHAQRCGEISARRNVVSSSIRPCARRLLRYAGAHPMLKSRESTEWTWPREAGVTAKQDAVPPSTVRSKSRHVRQDQDGKMDAVVAQVSVRVSSTSNSTRRGNGVDSPAHVSSPKASELSIEALYTSRTGIQAAAACDGVPDECERARLIGDLTRLLREPDMPEKARLAGLTLIGWLARRMPGESPHAIGVTEARESEHRLRAARKAR